MGTASTTSVARLTRSATKPASLGRAVAGSSSPAGSTAAVSRDRPLADAEPVSDEGHDQRGLADRNEYHGAPRATFVRRSARTRRRSGRSRSARPRTSARTSPRRPTRHDHGPPTRRSHTGPRPRGPRRGDHTRPDWLRPIAAAIRSVVVTAPSGGDADHGHPHGPMHGDAVHRAVVRQPADKPGRSGRSSGATRPQSGTASPGA